MKFSPFLYAAAFAAVFAPGALAQDYLPPAELVDRVLSEHPDVAAGQARLDGSRREAERLAAGPHEWTVTGSYLQRSVGGVGDFSEYDVGLVRAFRLPGKEELDRRIGTYGIDAAQNAGEDARHQAALQLMTGWIAWLSARELDAINGEQRSALEKEVEAVEKRLAVDDAAEIDLEMARSALSEARAAAARSAGEVARSMAFLRAWFPGLELPGNPIMISAPAKPDNAERLSVLVVEHSHEIEYFEALAKKAIVIAERTRTDQTPDPQFGLRAFSERDGEETGIGLTFSMPLGGKARSASTYERFAEAAAASQEAQRVRRAIADTAKSDAIQAQSEYEAWTLARAALDDSTRAIQRLRDGFAIGASGLQEMLSAERRHLSVQQLEADARARAATAILKLQIDAHELWMK